MHKNEAVEVLCTPSQSIVDRLNPVLVTSGGFWGTTLSTGKQKRIPAEVPALEGLLYSYKQSL